MEGRLPPARLRTAPAAARTPETTADFAIDSIAAKPVKPCDGGVFGALNLLLFQERAGGARHTVSSRLASVTACNACGRPACMGLEFKL